MTYRRLPYEEYFINTSEDYTHTGRASYAVKYVAVKYNTTRLGRRLGLAHEVNYEIHYEPDRDVIQISTFNQYISQCAMEEKATAGSETEQN